jgi:hypothetical protein
MRCDILEWCGRISTSFGKLWLRLGEELGWQAVAKLNDADLGERVQSGLVMSADKQAVSRTVRVSTLELFFDLVFVFTLTQFTRLIAK